MTYAWLHVRYVWLLVFPAVMSCDYSFNAVPLVRSMLDWRNMASISMYAVVVAATLLAARVLRTTTSRQVRNAASSTLLAIAWGVLPFVPSSNLLFPVATVIGQPAAVSPAHSSRPTATYEPNAGERLLYLPSVGFCMLLANVATLARPPRRALFVWAVSSLYFAR